MKVALIGSRGIPAKYGGYETLVEELASRLIQEGQTEVIVSCESHEFNVDEYNQIKRIHIRSVSPTTFTVPSINDILAVAYLIKLRLLPDIIYFVANDGSIPAMFIKLVFPDIKILINPDGIEWKRPIKRSKYSQKWKVIGWFSYLFEKLLERLAVSVPDIVIADSKEIKRYLSTKYASHERKIKYIPYGARELLPSKLSPDKERKTLEEFGLESNGYYLTVARIVAENNIHLEVEGFKKSKSKKKLVIVGNFNRKDPYTRHLLKLKGDSDDIIFLDPIYEKEVLGVLRKNCFAYIHAYEVGGTNPSLLEQMLFKRPILAYDVPFNKEVLQEGGIYFKDTEDLANKMEMLEKGEFDLKLIKKTQIKRIKRQYNWEKVAKEYERVFRRVLNEI